MGGLRADLVSCVGPRLPPKASLPAAHSIYVPKHDSSLSNGNRANDRLGSKAECGVTYF